jgi:hypothetical protein
MASLAASYKINVSKKNRYCVWVFLFSSLFVVYCLMLLLFVQRCYFYCYYLLDITTLFATPYLMLLAWHYYSLLNTIAPIATPCSTLLFLLLFLTWHCCSSCYFLFDGVASCLTLLLLFLLLLLLFVQCYYSSCAHCLTLLFLYYPLFNTITPFVTLWSMLLLLLLLLGQRCS